MNIKSIIRHWVVNQDNFLREINYLKTLKYDKEFSESEDLFNNSLFREVSYLKALKLALKEKENGEVVEYKFGTYKEK